MRWLPLLLVAVLAAGCGGGSGKERVPGPAIAVVGGRTISRAEYDAQVAEAKRAYASRRRPFPAAGTPAYGRLRASIVRLLVERAQLEQKAPGLGVEIGKAQVDARRQLFIEQNFGGDEARYRARLRAQLMTDAEVRSALRAQLLSDRIFKAVTKGVKQSERTGVFNRWLDGVRAELAPTYAAGFAPPDEAG